MQFGEQQLRQLRESWHSGSWFYTNLGAPARTIVEAAYGIINVPRITPAQRSRAQEDVTLALSIFARKIGCDKSQAVHALLSGSVEHLLAALGRVPGNAFSIETVRDEWENAFRAINTG